MGEADDDQYERKTDDQCPNTRGNVSAWPEPPTTRLVGQRPFWMFLNSAPVIGRW